MNDSQLRQLLAAFLADELSPAEHEQLQAELKTNAHSRALYRELLDLEAALHTWAAEDVPSATSEPASSTSAGRRMFQPAFRPWLALVAALLLMFGLAWFWFRTANPTEQLADNRNRPLVRMVAYVGTFGSQHQAVWQSATPALPGMKFMAANMSLVSGVAELKLDSGTNLILQAPCQLNITACDAADLLAGNVVVHVTELSDGFTLTTPEANILDEGTEYAVSLTDSTTEVHVFDGCVLWEPLSVDLAAPAERIESGEARRFLRHKPFGGARIPLAERAFVREMEATLRETAGSALLAYDGFENLAGRLQSGRSGFGWAEGWTAGRPGFRSLGQIVDAPSDTVFGISRAGRRLLHLSQGDVILRDFAQPLPLTTGNTYFISFLLHRTSPITRPEAQSGQYFEFSLVNDGNRRGHRSRKWYTFGVTSEGHPFIKSVGSIASTPTPLQDQTTYFFVAKILVAPERTHTFLRIYSPSETLDILEPTTWTTTGTTNESKFSLSSARFSVAADVEFRVDELKIGTTWKSVTSSSIP